MFQLEGSGNSGFGSSGQGTILIAEDEPEVLGLITAILEQAGYRVLAAADGRQALELFNKNLERIDLALIDMVMPEMGGEEVYDHISRNSPGLPVIFHSGYNPDKFQGGVELPEEVKFLRKPYSADSILNMVAGLLGNPHER